MKGLKNKLTEKIKLLPDPNRSPLEEPPSPSTVPSPLPSPSDVPSPVPSDEDEAGVMAPENTSECTRMAGAGVVFWCSCRPQNCNGAVSLLICPKKWTKKHNLQLRDTVTVIQRGF